MAETLAYDKQLTLNAIAALLDAARRVEADWPHIGAQDALREAALMVAGDEGLKGTYRRADEFVIECLPKNDDLVDWGKREHRKPMHVIKLFRAAAKRGQVWFGAEIVRVLPPSDS